MKKWKFSIEKIILIAFCAVILIVGGFLYKKLSELTNQLTYLQDSTSVILSDMGNLQSNIEKTLQEEASMVEDYSITVAGLDFANQKYKVDISVVPKEYTDKTEVSIFFGTSETPLKRGKYAFNGSVDLPLDKDFDGNIIFLLSNGRKKTTEVLNDYQGLDLNLDRVLAAKLDKAPTYRNGELKLDADCDIELEGYGLYTFASLELITMLDDKRIDTEDLLAKINGTDNNQSSGEENQNSVDSTQEQPVGFNENDPMQGFTGIVDGAFAYEMPEPDTEDKESEEVISDKQHICISVRAKTTEGYRFEYTVFEGDYLMADQKMDKESFQWNTKNVAFDRNGNELELDIHEVHEEN